MQVASEIQSNLNNLKYYQSKIAELAKQQFQLDMTRDNENSKAKGIRLDCLGTIIANCSQIDLWTMSIAANLETATKQDKLLQTEEEELV